MLQFSQSSGIGKPQFAAAGLLFLYLLQCLWLITMQGTGMTGPISDHPQRVLIGLHQWRGGPIAGTPQSMQAEAARDNGSTFYEKIRLRDSFDQDRSPLYYLIAAAPFLVLPHTTSESPFAF